ncbi:MAG: hypothetical protein P1U86_12370 [Verrucomicrobiales bacterium]|nr:hypothetical protein [Verrucomicrobiales bacterium]
MVFKYTLTLGILLMAAGPGAAFEPLYERAPIDYHETEPDTPVTRLLEKAKREGLLSKGSDREILAEFLEALEVPIESQVLVFSKTSAQNSRISPETPRALYFSDDVYIGWVQGGEIEIASFDPKLGLVFHMLKLTEREADAPPVLNRERSCLNCHAGSSNHHFPGLMVRSVFPQNTGQPLFQAGTFHTRHDSPIDERWGGWYVSGEVEDQRHMGNAVAHSELRDVEIELEPMGAAEALISEFFNSDPYLNGPQSDVVALMVLEHQVGVHNALVEANLTTRSTLHRHREMQKAFGESVDAPLSETNQRVLKSQSDRVLKQLLFADEFQLPAGVEGSEAFQRAFAANERKSEEGRSLKDFRLYERLMKYRCSHLIYSDAFGDLPDIIRTLVLEDLHSILTKPDSHPDFAYLSDSEREHIFQILSETMEGLPPVWKGKG